MAEPASNRKIFIAGGTGYVGRHLIPELLRQGHLVQALARRGSEQKLPSGCAVCVGNVLDKSSFAHYIKPADTFVHLVGVSHPSPAKAREFRTIDLASVQAAAPAAREAGVSHFIYLSVAHPAPVMKAYTQVRAECEVLIRATGMNASILRPWYILGPDHRWPYLLVPAYWFWEKIPSTREMARRLGLVKLPQVIGALLHAVSNPATGVRILEVPELRQFDIRGR